MNLDAFKGKKLLLCLEKNLCFLGGIDTWDPTKLKKSQKDAMLTELHELAVFIRFSPDSDYICHGTMFVFDGNALSPLARNYWLLDSGPENLCHQVINTVFADALDAHPNFRHCFLLLCLLSVIRLRQHSVSRNGF